MARHTWVLTMAMLTALGCDAGPQVALADGDGDGEAPASQPEAQPEAPPAVDRQVIHS